MFNITEYSKRKITYLISTNMLCTCLCLSSRLRYAIWKTN